MVLFLISIISNIIRSIALDTTESQMTHFILQRET